MAGNDETQHSRAPTPEEAPRTRRTHLADLMAIFRSYSTTERLTENTEIEARNVARKQQRKKHKKDKTQPNGSDDESMLTLTPDDLICLKDESWLAHHMAIVPEWLQDQVAKWRAAKRAAPEVPDEPSSKRFRTGPTTHFILGQQKSLSFHDSINETDKYTPLPNWLFFTDTLAYISNNAHTLPLKKVNDNGANKKKVILDLEKLALLPGVRFCDDLTLDQGTFTDCIDNRLRYEESVDADGPTGSHASWYRSHIGFEKSLDNRLNNFPAWRKAEGILRADYFNYGLYFDAHRYKATMDKEITAISVKDLVAEEMAAFRASYASSHASGSGFSAPKTDSRNGSAATPSAPRPFRDGSESKSPPVCIYCAKEGHTGPLHYSDSSLPSKFPDGKPIFCSFKERSAFTPAGKPICGKFNIGIKGGRPCNHGDNFAHVCSFCGSTAHHALSWTCRRRA